jgi:NodT family efflux transporter outer membrane factor (OMF) lipoprotein
MEMENAVANAQASAADLENVRLSMQAELATDYFQAHELDMEADVLNTSIQSYERFLQLTINRYNGGVASRADVAQAQTQLDTTRAEATDLGVARSQFEHAIAVLIGAPPANFTLPGAKLPTGPPPIPAGVPSQLLERRPDIAAAERRMAAANAEIGLARVAYYPNVSISASAGLSSTSIADWFTWPSRFFSIGPSASYTILDFGRRRSTVAEFRAAYDATVAAYRQTVLGSFQEVEDNLAALRILSTEAAQQSAATRGAEESLRLELDMYRGGTVSYLNVIQTQNIALSNERAEVQLLGRRMSSAVQLILALGGGWNASTLPSAGDLKANVTNPDASKVAQPPAQ